MFNLNASILINLMKTNLLELLKEHFNSKDNLREDIDESQSSISSGLNLVLPIVLGSIIKKASYINGLKDLVILLDEAKIHNENGAHTVHKLYGSELETILKIVSKETGIKEHSACVIFNMVTPYLINLINIEISINGLGISGLGTLIMSQAEHVKNDLPPGIAEKIGFDELGDFLGDTNKETLNASTEGFRMLIPWVLGLVALLAALYYLRTCSKQDGKLPTYSLVEQLTTNLSIHSFYQICKI
ncbi:MAG TPA: DUF937 domain-containing protein [Saprospiraceae bacterium]|nr:DUF937 domain-containing protein [Saprospiraceae bacterium]